VLFVVVLGSASCIRGWSFVLWLVVLCRMQPVLSRNDVPILAFVLWALLGVK
jgi:hypothetical protein